MPLGTVKVLRAASCCASPMGTEAQPARVENAAMKKREDGVCFISASIWLAEYGYVGVAAVLQI